MKITLYKSKYNWNDTITKLNAEPFDQDTQPSENSYYSYSDFEIHSGVEGQRSRLILKPFFKRKSKQLLGWQMLLNDLVSSENESLDGFLPELSYNFDAILIIKQISTIYNSTYMVTFGQAYHDIYDIIDFEFGIDFAERAIRNENVITKNVSFFQQNRLKEVTNYRRNSVDFARPTESYSSISGNPDDSARYGKTIHCGLGVSLNVPNDVINFKDKMIQLVCDTDELITGGRILNPFPRLSILKNSNQISSLDSWLLNTLKTPGTNMISSVDLSRLIEIQNYIIFLDEMPIVNLYIKRKKLETKQSFDHTSDDYKVCITDFLIQHNVLDINEVMIEIIDNNSDPQNFRLKRILHAEVDDNGMHYLLQNGNWGTYNQEFFDVLNNYLDQIDVEIRRISPGGLEFSKDEEDYIKKIQSNTPNDFKVLHKHFIKPNNQNFIVRGNGVELADLYNIPNNELITVKKGVSTSLSLYSLEQSMLAMNSLNHVSSYDFSEIEAVLSVTEYNNLKYSNTNSIIWILPLKESNRLPVDNITHTNNVMNGTFKLTQLGSVLLKNKLVEWALFSMENRLRPTIYMECPIDDSK